MNVFELSRLSTSKALKNFLIIFLFANILSLINSNKIDTNYVEELNEKNFLKFVEDNHVYLICLSQENEKSTREIKNILIEVGKKWETDYSLDKNTNSNLSKVKSAIFDPIKYKGIPLQKQLIYEGFPTLYYVNKLNDEIEAYIGSINVNSLLKYLKHKLIFDIEEVQNESELEKNMNFNKIQSAIVFIGNPAKSNFNLETLAKAAKISGFKKTYIISDHKETDDFSLTIYNPNSKLDKFHKLNVTIEEGLDVSKLSQIILINNRYYNQGYFHELNDIDLEHALNRNIKTVLYLYSDRKQLPTEVEADFVELAQKYRNEILFVKGSINSKSLKQLRFQRVFNITKNDLPIVVYLKPNPFNDDDVEKYILKTSQSQDNSASLNIGDVLNKRTVENFIRNVNKGRKEKIYTTEYDEVSFKLTGENFLPIVKDAIEEETEILLMICPRVSKKYDRIKKRTERVFEKLYNINENKILFDEFDPITNELSFIDYKYYPTLLLIQSDSEQLDPNKKWKYTKYEKDFSNEEIIKFIKENSRFDVKVDTTLNNKHVNKEEKKYPIYPILKYRFESKFLIDNLVKYEIGLKRRWFALKKNRIVLLNEDMTVYETGNEYEEDAYTDNMDANDENVQIDKREDL